MTDQQSTVRKQMDIIAKKIQENSATEDEVAWLWQELTIVGHKVVSAKQYNNIFQSKDFCDGVITDIIIEIIYKSIYKWQPTGSLWSYCYNIFYKRLINIYKKELKKTQGETEIITEAYKLLRRSQGGRISKN